MDGQPGPPTLERPDRVDRLHLDDDRATRALGQALVQVLGGVEEDRIDAAVGRPDRGRRELGIVSWACPPRRARTQRNARRNLRPVPGPADVSTCGTAFGLVAPSGKTKVRDGARRGKPGYPRTSMSMGRSDEARPQVIHRPARDVSRLRHPARIGVLGRGCARAGPTWPATGTRKRPKEPRSLVLRPM